MVGIGDMIPIPHQDPSSLLRFVFCHRIVCPQFSLTRKTPQEAEKVLEIEGLIVP